MSLSICFNGQNFTVFLQIKLKKGIDKLRILWYHIKTDGTETNSAPEKWKLSSAGRASALQAEGHRFEPYSFHHMAS